MFTHNYFHDNPVILDQGSLMLKSICFFRRLLGLLIQYEYDMQNNLKKRLLLKFTTDRDLISYYSNHNDVVRHSALRHWLCSGSHVCLASLSVAPSSVCSCDCLRLAS